MKRFVNQVLFIARIEAGFFQRFPKLRYATAAVALIPALYATIYLSSLWDPAAHSSELAVGIVNLDQGVQYREDHFNVGSDVVDRLKARKIFGFRDYTQEDLARRDVRQGRLAFALIIPPDFSSNAVPGAQAGAGKLVVYTSEGNNFESAALARHFAEELGHQVNESLNEQRWGLVLTTALGSRRSVESLREGVSQLLYGANELSAGATATVRGAQDLAAGSARLNVNLAQATTGIKQLGAGVRTIDTQIPPHSELKRIQTGADALAEGHAELSRGLSELERGASRLQDGLSEFHTQTSDSLLIPSRVSEGADQLAQGAQQLHNGLQLAVGSQRRLADGAREVQTGVGALLSGVDALGTGIHTVASKLPTDSQLDTLGSGAGALAAGAAALSTGTLKVKMGSAQLETGLELLTRSLPGTPQTPDGSAQGLAHSVLPQVEVEAVVQNNGSGFAPNVIPAALWLGASIAAFLVHVRVLPRHAQFFARPAQLLGKMLVPALVVLVQAVLVLLTALYILKIHTVSPWAFALTLCVASLTFLVIVLALTRAFGDAGKALAMIFLAIQLSSSGGIVPIELSGGLFASISPWLPLTWVVRAIKASMFGAFDADWLHPLLVVALFGLLGAIAATTVGRWRYVKHTAMRPAIDL